MTRNAPVPDLKSDREETYDEWFRRQIEEALIETDDPNTVWVSHDDVEREWTVRRQEIHILRILHCS